MGKRTTRDLSNQRFGRLVVLGMGRNDKNEIICNCICDCGNTHIARPKDLLRGFVKSCGCYKREVSSLRTRLNLVGMKFGRLTVIEFAGLNKNHRTLWLCKCECGKESIVRGMTLVSGKTKSCGCLRSDTSSNVYRDDLVGQVFGRLTVLESIGVTSRYNVIWRCQCECGNILDTIATPLKNGKTKSCGCWKRDKIVEACRCSVSWVDPDRPAKLLSVFSKVRPILRAICSAKTHGTR